ncbi:isoprenyl transferase [Paradesulfitobacterium aromaticivorans]
MWLSPWKRKHKEIEASSLDLSRLPRHIAIIMDGNGRWAKKRGLPRSMGHRAGVEALRSAVKECSRLGIEVLTVYAFSTENWRRPKEEVGVLMSLLTEYLRLELDELHSNRVVVRALGGLNELPPEAQRELNKAFERTRKNDGLILNLALNYGGRAEIVEAVQEIATLVQQGKLKPEEIEADTVSGHLATTGLPDPDLLIRTSGEMRLSNFLLWQLAYSEIVVVSELWPDFNEKSLSEAIKAYQKRDRRFGGLAGSKE